MKATKPEKQEKKTRPVVTKHDQRTLRVELTRDEIFDAGQKLADAQAELAAAENDLASYKDQIKSRTTKASAEIDYRAALVRQKYEFRLVKCDIVMDYEEQRVKMTRTDTGEVVEDRRMTDSEAALLPMGDE